LRICLVNTYHYRRGGDSTYTLDLASLLESHGHAVSHFAMKHPRNLASPYEPFFIEHIDYRQVFASGNPVTKARAFLRSLYSFQARARFADLLRCHEPDVVHLQNFRRHLTFSILGEAKKRGIPIVYTAHDYDPICPNSLLFAHGRICTRCEGKAYHHAVGSRCKEGSVAGSLAIALEGAFVRLMRYYRDIRVIITPSIFTGERLVEYGFPARKVRAIHNFIDAKAYEPAYGGSGAVYFGRLASEKGIETLIAAARNVPEVGIVIAGEGPERPRLEELCMKSRVGNVDFLGYVQRPEVLSIVRGAMCVIMPSIWYENFPYAILEAFALGTPVVASDIGGMPEIVEHGRTGLLFPPGDALALSQRIKYLQENPQKAVEMGRNARRRVEQEFNAEEHYRKIMQVYSEVRG
jgi:glycosyltransferase involved in cell wall biosynthesis